MRLSLVKAAKVSAFVLVFYGAAFILVRQNTDFSTSKKKFVGSLSFEKFQHGGQRESLFEEESAGASVLVRQQRSAKSFSGNVSIDSKHESLTHKSVEKNWRGNVNGTENPRETTGDDVFVAVKTTKDFHLTRMKILMETWIPHAQDQTYIFTDEDDPYLIDRMPHGHVINTKCEKSHYRTALCCKMSREFDFFMESGKRWFCHVDDDTYLNFPLLVKTLRRYDHNVHYYLGKPSLRYPIETVERPSNQKIVFWFATGGAGFCISRELGKAMIPRAGGGRFRTAGDAIRLPDDCTMGYIINYHLKVDLTKINNFHSHLEALWRIKDPENQLTFSYSGENMISVNGFNMKDDPTRFKSAHCRLYPNLKMCFAGNEV